MSNMLNHPRPGAISFAPPRHGPDHVTILMATYNGADTIDAQLESLARQSHGDWSLIVSDDGSTDDTLVRVAQFARRMKDHRIAVLRGAGQGSAMNFLSLLRAAGKSPWAAFCDQDDVWLEDRLARGLCAATDCDAPTLYGGRTMITNEALVPLRPSPHFRRGPSFGNALVQNIAGGNTMLLNRAALDVLQPASQSVRSLVSHDWWVYQMITGIGGRVIYDSEPTVLYRQHGRNQVGANDTLAARIHRLRGLFGGRLGEWLVVQTAALAPSRDILTPEARTALDALSGLGDPRLSNRLKATMRARLHRQSWQASLALWLAVVARRV